MISSIGLKPVKVSTGVLMPAVHGDVNLYDSLSTSPRISVAIAPLADTKAGTKLSYAILGVCVACHASWTHAFASALIP